MTIRAFEILLYTHDSTPKQRDLFLNEILAQINGEQPRRSLGAILENMSLFKNHHLEGKMDFFSHLMTQFAQLI